MIYNQTFPAFFPCTAEGDTLVDQGKIPHDRRLPDHYSHTVVNKYAFADRGSRMDLNTCDESGKVGNQARNEGNP